MFKFGQIKQKMQWNYRVLQKKWTRVVITGKLVLFACICDNDSDHDLPCFTVSD